MTSTMRSVTFELVDLYWIFTHFSFHESMSCISGLSRRQGGARGGGQPETRETTAEDSRPQADGAQREGGAWDGLEVEGPGRAAWGRGHGGRRAT